MHTTDWPGYGPQQQRGIALATGDWVLSLDADERVSESLKLEILAALAQDAVDASEADDGKVRPREEEALTLAFRNVIESDRAPTAAQLEILRERLRRKFH